MPVLELINESYEPIYGFVPLTETEMKRFARQYIPILDPDFVKVVMFEGTMVGFVVAMPDISDGLIKSKGQLLPFGWIHILRSLKKSKKLVLLLGAIKPGYRGVGIDVLMAVKLLESAIHRNMNEIESHLILEYNSKMIGEVLKTGGRLHKRFSIFQKNL